MHFFKILGFTKNTRFCCIDVAIVDLLENLIEKHYSVMELVQQPVTMRIANAASMKISKENFLHSFLNLMVA